MSEHPDGEAVDAQVVPDGEEKAATGNGHAPAGAAQMIRAPAPTPALALTPQFGAEELVKRLGVIESAMKDAMKDGLDYGNIPGGSKPTLLKPGAEKLSVLFQLDIEPTCHKRWDGDHLTVVCEAIAYHAPTGARLGKGEGVCSTREKKYAKRRRDRVCPECGEPRILRSRHKDDANPEAPPGWFCWKRKGGCGANYAHDDPKIVSQEEGEIDNPDLPDVWNTVVKIAEKRARVDVVLAVTGASALFTQDVEDTQGGPPVDDEVESGKVPRWGVVVGEESMPRIQKALAYMLDVGDGPNEDAAKQIIATLTAKFGDAYEGSMPAAAGHAIFEAALLLSKIRTGPDQVPDEPTGDPAGEGGEDADIKF
jgi:hypothetical protein